MFRASHPAVLLYGDASKNHLDPRLNLTEDAAGSLLRKTGATASCASVWGEDAIYDMVDCYGVAVTVDNYVYNNCSFCPSVTSIVNSACNGFLNQGVQQVTQAIDQATVELGLIKRKGIVKVDSETKLSGGKWYGSLAGGDFPGEFTATKK